MHLAIGMVEAVVFDIDGTLIDSVDAHALAWEAALKHFGRHVPYDQIRAQIGKGGDQILPVFFSAEEIRRFGNDLLKLRSEIFRREYLPGLRPFPSVRELLERLHADGVMVVLASSSKRDEVEAYRRIMGVGDLVDAATSADDVERTKPAPDVFAAALARCPPGVSVVVGDSPYDAQAARQLHVPVICLLCGGFPETELRQAGCMAIYASPADLLAHYEHAFSPRAAA